MLRCDLFHVLLTASENPGFAAYQKEWRGVWLLLAQANFTSLMGMIGWLIKDITKCDQLFQAFMVSGR